MKWGGDSHLVWNKNVIVNNSTFRFYSSFFRIEWNWMKWKEKRSRWKTFGRCVWTVYICCEKRVNDEEERESHFSTRVQFIEWNITGLDWNLASHYLHSQLMREFPWETNWAIFFVWSFGTRSLILCPCSQVPCWPYTSFVPTHILGPASHPHSLTFSLTHFLPHSLPSLPIVFYFPSKTNPFIISLWTGLNLVWEQNTFSTSFKNRIMNHDPYNDWYWNRWLSFHFFPYSLPFSFSLFLSCQFY